MGAAAGIEDGRLLPPALAEALTRGTSIGAAVFSILVGNTGDHPRNHAAYVNADGSLTLSPAYDICPQPRSAPQADQAMAIGRDGQRTSQIISCRTACETYLLSSAQAHAIIDEQIEIIRTQRDEAARAARLTELDRRQLYGREILNEFIFRA
jgi:serine/threonine-protein kinase HipA